MIQRVATLAFMNVCWIRVKFDDPGPQPDPALLLSAANLVIRHRDLGVPAMPTPSPPTTGGPGQTFTVNEDNVLAARKVILSAAEDAMRKLDGMKFDLVIKPSAEDSISTPSAEFWNRSLLTEQDSHFNRLRQYVTNVLDMAKQVEEAAKQYGYTEEEIAVSFQSHAKQH